jgi:hypothetical protein
VPERQDKNEVVKKCFRVCFKGRTKANLWLFVSQRRRLFSSPTPCGSSPPSVRTCPSPASPGPRPSPGSPGGERTADGCSRATGTSSPLNTLPLPPPQIQHSYCILVQRSGGETAQSLGRKNQRPKEVGLGLVFLFHYGDMLPMRS